MSLLKSIQGLISIGNALGITKPVFVGGSDCTGNAQALPICASTPIEGAQAVYMTPRPISVFRDSFSGVIASGINSNWDIIAQGAGQTISQAGGNLVLGSGATPNEEIIIRTKAKWDDAFVLRYLITSTSYQANAGTTIEMVDVLGDNLAVTSSGTAVSITTVAAHGYTSENIGQSLFIGAFKNLVGGGVIVPGQWAIASITNANTFVITATGSTGTVSSGTCSVWGHNSLRVKYNATSLTTAYLNSTRRGWNSAADTSVTVTTAATPSYGMWSVNDGIFAFNETTNNSNGVLNARGARTTGTPGADTDLYLQIRLTVGTSAPTAITTTIGMVSVEDVNAMAVDMTINRGVNTGSNAIPVNVASMPTTSVNNTVQTPSTSTQGITSFGLINAANSTNATSLKSSAGVVTSISLFNNGAAAAYFKLYNKASAPTLASDVPIAVYGIGAGQGRDISFAQHLRLGTGIAYAIVTGAANTDATAVAVNQVTGLIAYV